MPPQIMVGQIHFSVPLAYALFWLLSVITHARNGTVFHMWLKQNLGLAGKPFASIKSHYTPAGVAQWPTHFTKHFVLALIPGYSGCIFRSWNTSTLMCASFRCNVNEIKPHMACTLCVRCFFGKLCIYYPPLLLLPLQCYAAFTQKVFWKTVGVALCPSIQHCRRITVTVHTWAMYWADIISVCRGKTKEGWQALTIEHAMNSS